MSKQVISINEVFYFNELSDGVKQKKIEASRYDEVNNDYWYDSTLDDFKQILEIFGVTYNGIHQIMFSGFSSQGDGLCFVGEVAYVTGMKKKILDHAPKDETLHKIADKLIACHRKAKWKYEGTIAKTSSHYSHENTVDFTGVHWDGDCFDREAIESEMIDIMRWLMKHFYRMLEKEYEYLTSDEYVIERLSDDSLYLSDGTLFTGSDDTDKVLTYIEFFCLMCLLNSVKSCTMIGYERLMQFAKQVYKDSLDEYVVYDTSIENVSNYIRFHNAEISEQVEKIFQESNILPLS